MNACMMSNNLPNLSYIMSCGSVAIAKQPSQVLAQVWQISKGNETAIDMMM